MPQCHVCGTDIARGRGYRRRINTGESTGFTLRGSVSFRSYYGDRTVCQYCADEIDRSTRWWNRIGLVGAVASLFVAGLIIYFNSKARHTDDVAPVARRQLNSGDESPATQSVPAHSVPLLSPVNVQPKPEADEQIDREEKRLADQLTDLRTRLSIAEGLLAAAQLQERTEQERFMSLLKADPVYVSLQKAARDAEAKVIDARARGGAVETASLEWVTAVGKSNSYAKEHSAGPKSTEVTRQQEEVARLSELVSAATLGQIKFNARQRR